MRDITCESFAGADDSKEMFILIFTVNTKTVRSTSPLELSAVLRGFKLFSWQQQHLQSIFFFGGESAIYKISQCIRGNIYTDWCNDSHIYKGVLLEHIIYINIFILYLKEYSYKLHGCKDDVTHHDCIGCLICVTFKHA